MAGISGTTSRRRLATPRVAVSLLLLALVSLLGGGLANAEDGKAEDVDPTRTQLNKAFVRETVHGDPVSALDIYEGLIKAPGFDELAPSLRAEALLGAARCHVAAGRDAAAVRHWEAIRADDELPDEARRWARDQLQKRAKAAAPVGGNDADAEQRLLAKLRAQRRAEDMRKAQAHVEDARKALAAGRFDDATRLCFEALSKDETNQEANALLQKIESQRPDLGGLINHLIRFFQTQELTEFERVSERVHQLEELGSSSFNRRDWEEADRHLREAIRLIDESNFLTLGGTLDTNSLNAIRARLVVWLRQAVEQAAAQDIQLADVPPLPDIDARRGGLQQQFFGIMAQVFSPEQTGGTPLNFYKFAPTYKQGADAKRELDRIFFDDLKTTHRRGRIARAHWAEAWIRTNIGSRWADPRDERPVSAGSRSKQRLLLRLGELICAQSRSGEHARIEKLRRSFAETPPPLSVDVYVFAANTGGVVRATETLRLRAGPRDAGIVHVTGNNPASACAKELAGLNGVAQLGSARIRLDGETSILMELTEFTPEHPAYRKLPPPALAVPDADARFGLWLDLYAEDMPKETSSGGERSAIAVQARVTQPDPLVTSFVIPRSSGPEQPYTRLPLLTEVVREAHQIVPHFGALILQGLPNPFPATNTELGELIILVGTTRQDTPIPDPPRVQPSARIDPEDSRIRDYAIGSLSINVEDDVVPEDWPERRSVKDGMSEVDRRRLRNHNLSNILMQMANIDPNGPGGADAVQVQDHRAVATLAPDEHLRLERAVIRLRAHENDLYRGSIIAAVVDRPTWTQWSKLPGMKANGNANVIATGEGRAFVEQELTALAQRSGLFNTRRRDLLLRATQQRAYKKLSTLSITKGLRVRLLPRGMQRYTAEEGVAEEGLIVEVRPGLEVAQGKGVRRVRVRTRAARLDRIEERAYPGATQAAALYDVPIWHAGTDGAFSQRTEVEILGDDAALILPLSLPGSDDKIVLVYVSVTRVQ